MNRTEVREALFKKYIAPLQREKRLLVGIEIEMPVATLNGMPTSHAVTQQAFVAAAEHFGFEKRQFDAQGVCYNAIHPDNNDDFSFDCGFNNLEISLGSVDDINEAQRRFEEYVQFFNEELGKSNHILTGMGINPNHGINRAAYVDAGRYQMLGAYLHQCYAWGEEMRFHNYPSFGTFASASQVQLDVEEHEVIGVLKAFGLVEPLKAVIFSNSYMPEEPQLLCSRDMLWDASTHGINPHNVGFYEQMPGSVDELLDYIATTSMFCVERDGHYLFFHPIPVIDYFEQTELIGTYREEGRLHHMRFTPEPGDLAYLRTYKHEDLTYRGTVEFRSCCCQPLTEAMTVAAFHVGLMRKVPQLIELLEFDRTVLNRGYTPAELREQLNRRHWPSTIDRDALRDLCLKVLDLCREGLVERGLDEEHFIDPLFRRAERLESPARYYTESLESGMPLSDLVLMYSL